MLTRNRKSRKPSAQHAWKLQDAKARFSEVVRRAQFEGPQRITVRGKDAAVVIAASDYDNKVRPHIEKKPAPNLEGLTGQVLIDAMQKARKLGLRLKPFRAYLHERPPK